MKILGFFECLIKVEPRLGKTERRQILFVMDGYAAHDDVTWESAIVNRIERRCRRPVTGGQE